MIAKEQHLSQYYNHDILSNADMFRKHEAKRVKYYFDVWYSRLVGRKIMISREKKIEKCTKLSVIIIVLLENSSEVRARFKYGVIKYGKSTRITKWIKFIRI